MKAVIYSRVSTLEKGQNPETQILPLRDYAKKRGFDVVEEFIEYASGKTEERKEYKKLIGMARKRRIDVVLVWRYDRFARSTQALVNSLKEFQKLGVHFISYQENIDTSTPSGELIFHIMASIAQFESSLIGERVRAGMKRARDQGKNISRPPISKDKILRIMEMHKEGKSMNSISKEVKVSYGTVYKYIHKKEGV